MGRKPNYCDKCGIETRFLHQETDGRYLCNQCRGVPDRKETQREKLRKMWETDESVARYRVSHRR
jgi:hypothetical protein